MPDLSQWLTALSALLASLLAIWKDTRQEEPNSAKKGGLNKAGVFALLLAVSAFFLSILEFMKQNEAGKADAARAALIETINQQVSKALPGQISTAMASAQERINAVVERTNNTLGEKLASTVAATGQKLDEGVAKSIKSTEGQLTDIVRTTGVTMATQITGAVNKGLADAQTNLETVVKTQTNLAATSTSEQIAAAAKETNEKTRDLMFGAIHSMVAQMPISVPDQSVRRLPGSLEALQIAVGDISKTRPFRIEIRKDGAPIPVWDGRGQKALALIVDPKSEPRGEPHVLKLVHEGVKYRIEMIVQTPTNLFGQSPDSLLCHIILEPSA